MDFGAKTSTVFSVSEVLRIKKLGNNINIKKPYEICI
jgi:hypothetical protein